MKTKARQSEARKGYRKYSRRGCNSMAALLGTQREEDIFETIDGFN